MTELGKDPSNTPIEELVEDMDPREEDELEQRLANEELPGMWESADFEGGQTDTKEK